MDKQFIIAHRGGPRLVGLQENTIEAFRKSINIGIKVIEFDVRKTLDNKLIVIHDKSIAGLKVRKNTYEEIEKIANYRGYHIPLVEEVIMEFKGQVIFDVEVKESGYEEELVNMLKFHLNNNDFFMKSFKEKVVTKIKEIDSEIRVGLLIGGGYESKILCYKYLFDYFPSKKIKRTKPDFVSPQKSLSRVSFINRIKDLYNLDIYVWTVNNPREIKKMLAAGVKAIITDCPGVALNVLNEYQ